MLNEKNLREIVNSLKLSDKKLILDNISDDYCILQEFNGTIDIKLVNRIDLDYCGSSRMIVKINEVIRILDVLRDNQDYDQAVKLMQVAIRMKKINGFDASEVIGTMFPGRTFESIMDDLIDR